MAVRGTVVRKLVVVFGGEQHRGLAPIAKVPQATNAVDSSSGFGQRRQQCASQNRKESENHEGFNERETGRCGRAIEGAKGLLHLDCYEKTGKVLRWMALNVNS